MTIHDAYLVVYPRISALPALDKVLERANALLSELCETGGIDVSCQLTECESPDVYASFALTCGGQDAGIVVIDRHERMRVSAADIEEYERFGPGNGYPPEMLGAPLAFEAGEFKASLSAADLDAINLHDHLYIVSTDGTPAAIIAQGLVAAAVGEQVDGVLGGDPQAMDLYCNGETPSEVLSWWGRTRLAWFGTTAITNPGGPQHRVPEIY